METVIPVSQKLIRYRRIAWFVALIVALAATGCQSTEPHVTAKVIFQHDDVAAELTSEWR